MIRAAIIAGVLAICAAPAQALTIEEARAAARTGVNPLVTNADADMFHACGLPPIVPQATVPLMEAIAEAKAAGVEVRVMWIRHNLKGIEACLARPGNQ